MDSTNRPQPVPALQSVTPYAPVRSGCPVDLRLDGNEGRTPRLNLPDLLEQAGRDLLRRYPDRAPLERQLAGPLGLPADGVLVTAGGDEAIDRLCRSYLDSTRNLVTTSPTFEMIPRYARLSGAEVRQAPWPGGAFPTEAVLDLVDARTGIIAVVSPNNPTGAVATAADLQQLSAAAPQAVLLVDLAYGEFADTDLSPAALQLPNAVVIRSLSKAWGLAGLRVGYAAGPAPVLAPLRAAGGPFAVSGLSLLTADAALKAEDQAAAFIAQVKRERVLLQGDLQDLGVEALPSQANFVFAHFSDPVWVRDGLAGLGIAVRLFRDLPGPGPLRITCPGGEEEFQRLRRSLNTVLAPQALLLDMDGVLADVSRSYRTAIILTAARFGVEIEAQDVAAAKRLPGSNNDWVLTRRLLAERGVDITLAEVTACFQDIYGDLSTTETLIPDPALLLRLAARLPLAVVTGRPRADARTFLQRAGIGDLFATVVCLEDGPDKPDPATVALALQQLGVQRAWMVGDTVNDAAAARAAGVLPVGIVPPGENDPGYPELLITAGCGRVLSRLDQLEELLP